MSNFIWEKELTLVPDVLPQMDLIQEVLFNCDLPSFQNETRN
jgi:hypothetical protein